LEHQRQRTKSTDIAYGLYLTFLVYLIEIILQRRYKGLFIVQAMSPSGNKWIKKKYKPKKVSSKRKKSNEFIIDETQIKVDWFFSIYIWFRVAIN
jgi:hypothetical protein